MKPFWVYILYCADNSLYIGHTDNIEKRIAEHNAGKISGYTSARLPIKLLFTQSFMTRVEAIVAERKIKGWRRSKKDALIQGDWKEIIRISNLKK